MERKHLFEYYNRIGRENIKATSSDFTNAVGDEGVKDIIRKVFLGGNVRDTTEFITQRRLVNSYYAMVELFLKHVGEYAKNPEQFSELVATDLIEANRDEKIIALWLLGLTKKGLDNIVRSEDNIRNYQEAFSTALRDITKDLQNTYGDLSGEIRIQGNIIELDWTVFSAMLLAIGAQTLSIRGSAKSMNGKLFEKLVLGTLLELNGFHFLEGPPETIDKNEKLFWLSNMDDNERETDATLVYGGKAVSIDIGFIGKGNPEITLDKVTRFNAYKEIGGLPHDMATIIVVDTIAPNSDLINKAKRVNGHVFQMKEPDWTIGFSSVVSKIFGIETEIAGLTMQELNNYYTDRIVAIDVNKFI